MYAQPKHSLWILSSWLQFIKDAAQQITVYLLYNTNDDDIDNRLFIQHGVEEEM